MNVGKTFLWFLLLPSIAAGQTNWVRQSPLPGLNAVAFVDSLHGIAVGVTVKDPETDGHYDSHGVILQTSDGGGYWEERTVPTDDVLRDVQFVDHATAFAVGTGVILVTTDQGNTWARVPSGTNQNLYRIHFFDRQNGIITGEAVVLHTSDGGASWQPESDGTMNRLNSIAFSDSAHGIAVGDRGTILQTSDGGLHWRLQPAPTRVDLRSVASPDSHHTLAIGLTPRSDYEPQRSILLRTTSGAQGWSEQRAPFGVALSEVGAVNATTYFAVGDNTILRTTDGGATWDERANGTTHSITAVALLDTSTIIVAGDDGLRRSTDGGRTWRPVELEPISRVGGYRMAFDDRGTGIVMRDEWSQEEFQRYTWRSKVLRWRSTDGGASWVQLSDLPCAAVHELTYQRVAGTFTITYDMTASLEPQGFALARSTDAGMSWVPLTNDDRYATSLALGSASKAVRIVQEWDSLGFYSALYVTSDSGDAWKERYRLRQGRLNHLSFFDSTTAVAVGCVGDYWDPNQTIVVVRTTDAGLTWTRFATTAKGMLTRVALASTTGLAIGSADPGTGRVTTIYRTTDAGLTWSPLASPTRSSLTDVALLPDGAGVIVGPNGDVWCTTDRGTTWINRSGSIRGNFQHVAFFDAQNGYVAGSGVSDIGERTQLALFTTDGGLSWTRRTLAIPGEVGGISFASPAIGMASTRNPNSGDAEVFMTTDGGVTWTRRYAIARHRITSVHLYSTTGGVVGLATGTVDSSGASYLISTTNGGASWSYAHTPAPSYTSHTVTDDAKGHVYLVGDHGSILSTSDRGVTWSAPSAAMRVNFYDVHFTDRLAGTAVGAGTTLWGEARGARVLRTSDGGHSWSDGRSSDMGALNGIWHLTPSTAFAVGSGDSSVMFKTDDGGNSWIPIDLGDVDVLHQVAFWSPTEGAAVGGQGDRSVYLFTTDGGATWIDRQIGWFGTLKHMATDGAKPITMVSSSSSYFGVQGMILSSTDAGVTWIGRHGTLNTLNAVDFYDVLHGVAVGAHGTILHTIDGGDPWTTVTSGTICDLYDVCFSNASTAVAVGDSGTIVRSTDGGISWSATPSGTTQRLRGVSFQDAVLGVVVGDSGTILRTSDGCMTWQAESCSSSFNWRDVVWVGDSLLMAAGGRTTSTHWGVPALARSDDGGVNWIFEETDSLWGPYLAIDFPSASIGYLLDMSGLYRTTDVGSTWIRTAPSEYMWSGGMFGGGTGDVHSFTALDDSTVIAVGQTGDGHFDPIEGMVIRSTDRGTTWQALSSIFGSGWGDPNLLNDVRPLLAVDFPTMTTGSVVGTSGVIYRTTNGGATWVETGGGRTSTPSGTRLEQNYPNPFNPETRIGYRMKERGWVKLAVYDLLGREVAVLVDEEKAAGSYEVVFGRPSTVDRLATGIYFCRLTAGNLVETKKMLLLR